MSEPIEAGIAPRCDYLGTYANGLIRLSAPVDWAEGTRVLVRVADVPPAGVVPDFGKVIIAGFGLAGRWLAEIFDRHNVDYVIIEQNAETVETQRKLGRRAVNGDVSDPQTLGAAGIVEASILALTIPDENATRRATQTAKALNPNVYVVGRTMFSSSGMAIEQLGADEIIKVEQIVAREFYEVLLRKLACRPSAAAT